MSTNLYAIKNKLTKAGIQVKALYESPTPEIEDNEILITDSVRIQVASYGDGYMTVYKIEGDGFLFYPERLRFSDVMNDLLKAMK